MQLKVRRLLVRENTENKEMGEMSRKREGGVKKSHLAKTLFSEGVR